MTLSHHIVSQSFLSRRRLLAGGLALTGAGALAACSSGTASRAASASAAGGALTIGLTYTPNIQFAPFYMAKKDGTYAANVTLHHHGAQDGLFDALQSGQEQLVIAGADEAVQELDCRVLRDEEEAVWFGVRGGDFGDGFGGGDAHGCG